MYWTLSEFLNVFEFRGQSWSFVDVGEMTAIRAAHSDVVHFYAATRGSFRITGAGDEIVTVGEGDIVFVLSGEAHTVRHRDRTATLALPPLREGSYVDGPPTVLLGEGAVAAQLLYGRLKVRWPSGQPPRGLPACLRITPDDSLVELPKLVAIARGEGGSALLTHAATLVFVSALRAHPQCKSLFEQSNRLDPIAQAQQFIELHPFQKWTVEGLAKKVGMCRSNFAARFTAQTGKTPIDVLAQERMKHAADFLARTDLKISEISERVGYRSQAAFHNRFSSFFGVSPGKLRHQRRHALLHS